MKVKELNRDQLDELKWTYFYSDDFDEKNIRTPAGLPVLFAGDIPDDIIFAVYAGVDFVNDDFSCSAGKQNYTSFVDDREKIDDLLHLSQDEFLASYSYLTPEEYALTIADIMTRLFPETPATPEKPAPLRVCYRCLCAIESREGSQITRKIYLDDDDPQPCDWCDDPNDTQKALEIFTRCGFNDCEIKGNRCIEIRNDTRK